MVYQHLLILIINVDIIMADEETISLIKSRLNISEKALVVREQLLDLGFRFKPDMVIEDTDRILIVEIGQTITFEVLAQLRTYRDILKNRYKNSNVEAVIAVKTIAPSLEDIARLFEIVVLQLPGGIDTSGLNRNAYRQKTRLTSEKTWKLISCLLKEHTSSIRQIAIKSGVSYGLAHLAMNMLVEKGIVARKTGYYEVVDVKKLLNGIAWERPLDQLKGFEIDTAYGDAHNAARQITAEFMDMGIDVAFTSYTAGSLYTGYAVRHDAVYLYLEKEYTDKFIQMFEHIERGGVRATVYVPDRDVFMESRNIESVSVVSPGQALLDLAGLGYSGMDMTNALVEKYGNL